MYPMHTWHSTMEYIPMNKQEGRWRQMKAHLSHAQKKKEHYLSYLAEFIWRYVNRGKDLFKVFLKDVARVYKLE